MAYDDVSLDWEDDPFAGDFGLDMDFDYDPYKGKGLLRSAASGFLSGLVSETVGSSGAAMRTMRTALPKSFSNALDRVNWVAARFEDLKIEFKEENAQSVKSLQSIAGTLSKKMAGKMPSGLVDRLDGFSQKDFSSWEKMGDYQTPGLAMEEVQDYDIASVMDRVMNSQEGMFTALGDSLNQMSAATAGHIAATVGAGNRQLIGIETGMRDLVNYQRNVQFKMDQAQLSLSAKQYLAAIKYYKFVEKGTHTQIQELKKIVQSTRMSDFEKTSTVSAGKKALQNKMFSTVGKRVGGLSGLITSRFGKDARKEGYEGSSMLLEMIAEGLEASSDVGMSKGMLGEMIGKYMARRTVDGLPYLAQSKLGKNIFGAAQKRAPEQTKKAQEMWKKLNSAGHVASYGANAGLGLVNYMAEDYEHMDEMEFLDYEDYLDSLKPGEKPLNKALWTVKNGATNSAKSAFNNFMSETTKARGTQYTLNRRKPGDLAAPSLWNQGNNITLQEVIPGLLSKILQSTEGIRTGSDQESVSFNYMRGEFQGDAKKRVAIQADLMPYADFSRYASAALELVDSIDPDKQLSSAARKSLAQQVAKDVDQDKGFNPYYYLGEIPNVSPAHQKEIHAVVRKYFDIEDKDVAEFKSKKGFERMKKMSVMNTDEAKERLNTTAASASNMRDLFPNVAERIDMLRSTGNEQMLRDLGVIYTESGIDKVNMDVFHERLGKFMDNPNDPTLRGMMDKGGKPAPSKVTAPGATPRQSITEQPIQDNTELVSSLSGLSEQIKLLSEKTVSMAGPSTSPKDQYFDSMTGELSSIKDNTTKMAEMSVRMESLFVGLLERADAGKLFTGKPASAAEERAEARAESSVTKELKKLVPKEFLSAGFELLMKNQPLVFGSLLGTIGGSMMSNPIAGTAVAIAGGMAGLVVQKWAAEDAKKAGTGQEPSDDEDILDENGEPILSAAKLHAGMYFDAVSRRVIKVWRDIRGPLYDGANKVTIGITTLAGKIFGPDGRKVALSGLNAAKDAMVGAYNFVNPLQRVKDITELGKSLIYQKDIYVKGEKSPRLRAIKFKTGDYSVEDSNGQFKPLFGWNEITGPVYDEEGNQLISQEEFDAGLITSTGQMVSNVAAFTSSIVGGAAGMAKTGINSLLGKFGFEKVTQSGGRGPNATGKGVSNSGVERRLDRIYALLCKQFGIEVPESEIGGSPDPDDPLPDTPAARLNSLADKIRQAKEAKQEKTQDAIIDIAEGMGDKKEAPGEKKEGLFGKLFGMLGGLGSFAGNLIKNPLGTIGNLVIGSLANSTKRLASIGTALFSGVMGVGSPIFKLLAGGFKLLGRGLAGAGSLGGKMFGGPGKGGKILKGAGLAALAYGGANAAYDYFNDDNNGQEDFDLNDGENKIDTGRKTTAGDTALDVLTYHPVGAVVNTVAEAVVPKGIAEMLKDTGFFWASDGTFFTSEKEYQTYERSLAGGSKIDGSTYQNAVIEDSLQKQIRFAQYGIKDISSRLSQRVQRLETMLIPYVIIANGRAGFKQGAEVMPALKEFIGTGGNVATDNVVTWFNARFKPIFLLYAVGAHVGSFGDIVDFDTNKTYEVPMLIDRLRGSIATLDPNPLAVQIQIDEQTGLLNQTATNQLVEALASKLRKMYPVPTEELKIDTAEESREKTLSAEAPKGFGSYQNAMGVAAAKAVQIEVDTKYQTPKSVKEIDISDMHKSGNESIDVFTLTRLAVYGNVDNMPWRVDAVLKLERYCEEWVNKLGNQLVFGGNPTKIFNLFKGQFRIDTDQGEANWHLWFQNRFLPVMREYMNQVLSYTGRKPKDGWTSLSATNKSKIARVLADVQVTYNDQDTPVWDVNVAPFQNTKSGTARDRAERYMSALEAKAVQARIKEPELESERSKTDAQRKANVVPGAGRSKAANDMMMNTLYGNNRNTQGAVGFNGGGTGLARNGSGMANTFSPGASASGGFSGGADLPGGEYAGGYASTFNPEFTKQAGEDAGISMTPEQGEALMLNAMLKAGITDKKVLALGLAMAEVETGNYKNTVENTRWSSKTLQKLFRNIPNKETADKVAAMSAPERAMYVYGRNPKAKDLGNIKEEDGWNYRGRGLFQLTGRANYEAFKNESGHDVINNPRLLSENPEVMADSAVRFLKKSPAMMAIAKTGNVNEAMKGINGSMVPAADERRKSYVNYLSRLNSGELVAPPDTGAQVSVGEEYDEKLEPVPAAADNVKPETLAGEEMSGDAEKRKDTMAAKMDAADPAKQTTVTPPAKTTASSTTAAPASNKITVDMAKETPPTPPPAPVQAPKQAPISVDVTKQPSQQHRAQQAAPVQQAPVQTGTMQVVDVGAIQLLGQVVTSIDSLTRSLKDDKTRSSGVRTS